MIYNLLKKIYKLFNTWLDFPNSVLTCRLQVAHSVTSGLRCQSTFSKDSKNEKALFGRKYFFGGKIFCINKDSSMDLYVGLKSSTFSRWKSTKSSSVNGGLNKIDIIDKTEVLLYKPIEFFKICKSDLQAYLFLFHRNRNFQLTVATWFGFD